MDHHGDGGGGGGMDVVSIAVPQPTGQLLGEERHGAIRLPAADGRSLSGAAPSEAGLHREPLAEDRNDAANDITTKSTAAAPPKKSAAPSSFLRTITTGTFFDVPVDHLRGWIVVGAGFLNFFVLFGIIGSFTVFLVPFAQDPKLRGTSTALLNLAGSLQLALSRVVGLFGGFAISRFGSRKVIFVSCLAQFAAYFSTSYVTDIGGLIGVYTTLMIFALGFSLVPVLTSVSGFFYVKRNLAQGCLNAGIGFGGAIFPLIVARLLDAFDNDWRPVFRVCSSFSLVSVATCVLIPVHNDGLVATPHCSPRQYSRRKLIFNRPFVILSFYCFFVGFSAYGQGFMIIPFALQFASRSRCVLILTFAGISSVVGNVCIGALSDWIGLRRSQIIFWTVIGGLSAVWGLAVDGYDATMVLACLVGFFRPMGVATLIADLFKGHHVGEALAGTYLFFGAGAACAPPILAAITSARGGSFTASWIITGVTSVLAGVCVWALPEKGPNIYALGDRDPAHTQREIVIFGASGGDAVVSPTVNRSAHRSAFEDAVR